MIKMTSKEEEIIRSFDYCIAQLNKIQDDVASLSDETRCNVYDECMTLLWELCKGKREYKEIIDSKQESREEWENE